MMDSLYFDDTEDQIFLPNLIIQPSSFVPYTTPMDRLSSNGTTQNVHKRMIHFFKRNQTSIDSIEQYQEFHKERCHRHMMNERLRRGKEKRTYAAIHSLLPPGTKDEKTLILQMTALHLKEMKLLKENLQKRNKVLEENAGGGIGTFTLRRRQTHASGTDSMIGVLTCLKNMGLKARAIHSEFSAAEFFTVMEIQSKIAAVDVEKAIEAALLEVDRKCILDNTSTATYSIS